MKYRIEVNPSYSAQKSSRNMPYVHAHLEHEIYYLRKGEAYYFIEDKIFHVHENAFVFIHKELLHKTMYNRELETERILLRLDNEFLSSKEFCNMIETLKSNPINYVSSENLPLFHELFNKIENLSCSNKENEKILTNLYVAEILTLLSEYSSNKEYGVQAKDNLLISNIQNFIKKNLSSTLSLVVLSKEFSISKEHLSRKFKQKTGICINEFINHQRIIHATELLKNTSMPITRIAEECGFNDSNYFSTVFKKSFGISPKQFALKLKNER